MGLGEGKIKRCELEKDETEGKQKVPFSSRPNFKIVTMPNIVVCIMTYEINFFSLYI